MRSCSSSASGSRSPGPWNGALNHSVKSPTLSKTPGIGAMAAVGHWGGGAASLDADVSKPAPPIHNPWCKNRGNFWSIFGHTLSLDLQPTPRITPPWGQTTKQDPMASGGGKWGGGANSFGAKKLDATKGGRTL